MNTVEELLEILSSRGITQCDTCKIWNDGMNIDESTGLLACFQCLDQEGS